MLKNKIKVKCCFHCVFSNSSFYSNFSQILQRHLHSDSYSTRLVTCVLGVISVDRCTEMKTNISNTNSNAPSIIHGIISYGRFWRKGANKTRLGIGV